MDGNYGWWFAGLTDGEGCFDIHPVGDHFICRFTIGLRADDADLLYEAQKMTGVGSVRLQCMSNGAATQARWEVSRKAEVARLAEVFVEFPLRSKKRRDFEVWKRAVDVWVTAKRGNRWHGRSGHTEEMRELRQILRATRSFNDSFGSAEAA